MLPEKDKIRLIQLLGMLGSTYEGERLNAATLAHKILTHHKLSWDELLNCASATPGYVNRAAGGPKQWEEGFEAGLDRGAELARAAISAEYTRGFSDGVKSAKELGIKAERHWRAWAKDRINNDADFLTDWEINFFGDFSVGRYAVPSAKQRAIFERVAGRLSLELPE